MGRLVLVEGSPGSGKTATAQFVARWLSGAGARVALYCEGDPQPADLAWQWWLSAAEFDDTCRQFPGAKAELRRCAWVGAAGVAVAYTKVDPDRCAGQWPDIEAAMAGKEPFNGTVSPDTFVDILAARWAEFGASHAAPDAADVVVFDGAFLQDTLVELVLFADRDAASIADSLGRLVRAVAGWRPLLVRLVAVDAEAAIDAAGRERVDAQGRPTWREAVEGYTAGSPWARARGLSAPGALLAYVEHRTRLEDDVRATIPAEWVDLASPAGTSASWRSLEEQLTATLAGLVPRRSDPGGSRPQGHSASA